MKVTVTGAASGLGRALAEQCIARGDDVLAIDITACDLACETRVLDLTEADAPGQIAEHQTDLIIHSAGISGTGPFEDIPAQHHAKIISLNFEAPLQISCALLATGQRPHHAFVGSLSTFTGYPGATSYAASKDGLAAFAKSLGKAGHRTSCIFPGPLRTDHAARYAPDNSAKTVAARQSPEDAARLILKALAKGRRLILPGIKAKGFAVMGRVLPGPTAQALRRALYEQIRTPKT